MSALTLQDCNSELTIQSIKFQSSLAEIYSPDDTKSHKKKKTEKSSDLETSSDSESSPDSDFDSDSSPYGLSCDKTVKQSPNTNISCELLDSDSDLQEGCCYVINCRLPITLMLPFKEIKESQKKFDSQITIIKNKSPNIEIHIKCCIGNTINTTFDTYTLKGGSKIEIISNGSNWITL